MLWNISNHFWNSNVFVSSLEFFTCRCLCWLLSSQTQRARSTFLCFSETLPGFVSFLSLNITVVLCLPGDAFPWTISLSQFSIYTLLGQQQSLSLLEPMGCTSTLAVTSKVQSSSEGRPSFVVCLHVDLQPVHVKCSNPQVSQKSLKCSLSE